MRVLVLTGLLLAGCAGMSESECRTGNWYALGERDALLANQPRIDVYAYQCGRYGVKAAESDYMAGWTAGYDERSRRSGGGGGGMGGGM